MKCPEIFDLHFGPEGREAINDIANIKELGDLLATVLGGGGVIVTLFASRGTGNKRVDTGRTTYGVLAHDWNVWAQAMASVGLIKRAQIKKIAFDMTQVKTSPNENKFWRAVYDGCGR